jgi:hypothetical protein
LVEIGNRLGSFIDMDDNIFSKTNRSIENILVDVDLHEELPKIVEIEMGKHKNS